MDEVRRLGAAHVVDALLLALSEMDPCPDCGATLDEREEEPDEDEDLPDDGHAVDCAVATWLRLYGGATKGDER